MGCFKLPLGLCHEIEVLIRKFWWGQREEKRKIHWLKWDKMTKAKVEGGMGFCDLALYNDSLLAKQAWCLLQDKISLFYNVFKARFFPNCTIMEASESRNSSYIWKSIMAGQPILKKGCCWRVGDGSSIRVLADSWIPNHPTNKILIHPVEEEREWRVSNLMEPDLRCWNRELIMSKFHKEDAKAILRIPLS